MLDALLMQAGCPAVLLCNTSADAPVMMAHSHILFGMSCWWGYTLGTGQDVTIAATALAGLGALLPDIDHPQSALGRRIPLISHPLARLVGHRGVTHSLVAALTVTLALVMWAGQGGGPGVAATAPLAVGYLSHLAGDMLTPSGVPLLWPWRHNFSLKLFRTGSPVETVVVSLVAAALLQQVRLAPGLLQDARQGVGSVLREGPRALGL
jgi:inner membrane protein